MLKISKDASLINKIARKPKLCTIYSNLTNMFEIQSEDFSSGNIFLQLLAGRPLHFRCCLESTSVKENVLAAFTVESETLALSYRHFNLKGGEGLWEASIFLAVSPACCLTWQCFCCQLTTVLVFFFCLPRSDKSSRCFEAIKNACLFSRIELCFNKSVNTKVLLLLSLNSSLIYTDKSQHFP